MPILLFLHTQLSYTTHSLDLFMDGTLSVVTSVTRRPWEGGSTHIFCGASNNQLSYIRRAIEPVIFHIFPGIFSFKNGGNTI